MLHLTPHPRTLAPVILLSAFAFGLAACDGIVDPYGPTDDGSNGASIESGRRLFRSVTLGPQGYWSDAVGLGRGLMAEDFTMLDALELGLQFDAGAIDPALLAVLTAELGTDLSPSAAPNLNDSAVMLELLASQAVIGLCAVDEDGDDVIDLLGADGLGVACALCHSVTDRSRFDGPAGTTGLTGAIGRRVDGPAPSHLDLGGLFALADNSRALYPYLPQSHETIGGEPIARTGDFVDADTPEADVDALLRDKAAFPVGMWDVLPDGIGAPVMMQPVFDIRPAAPYGTAGEFPTLMDAINAHATLGLDPTTLLTPAGSVFMDRVALGIGTEIVNEFDQVLVATQVVPPPGGFPYIDAAPTGEPLTAQSPVGRRFARRDLEDLVTYLQTLVEPPPPVGDPTSLERGADVYAAACVTCHGEIRGMVPHQIVPLPALLVTYAPTTLLQRGFPYTDVLDDRLTTFDDRLAIFDRLYVDNQVPSQPRSIAAPHLTGLHLQSRFLHDGSIGSLDELLDPARGAGAPHPVYVIEPQRADLIEFLTRR